MASSLSSTSCSRATFLVLRTPSRSFLKFGIHAGLESSALAFTHKGVQLTHHGAFHIFQKAGFVLWADDSGAARFVLLQLELSAEISKVFLDASIFLLFNVVGDALQDLLGDSPPQKIISVLNMQCTAARMTSRCVLDRLHGPITLERAQEDTGPRHPCDRKPRHWAKQEEQAPQADEDDNAGQLLSWMALIGEQ